MIINVVEMLVRMACRGVCSCETNTGDGARILVGLPHPLELGVRLWVLMEFKVAMADFMTELMERTVSFDPSRLVLTSGATPALEILSFCLADQGNAFLIPAPYYPGFDRDMRWRTGV